MTDIRYSLHISQGIAEICSALPNGDMTTPTHTERHIGDRLRDEMQARGMSVSEVATLFGVKAPSVYDWLNFGRIAKKHIPQLVEVFGHTADWWITGEESAKGNASPGFPPRLIRLAKVLEGRSDEEIDRIARALELLIPPVESREKTRLTGRRFIVDDANLGIREEPAHQRKA